MTIKSFSLLALVGVLAVQPAAAERIDEIVAWVNGAIITKSDLDEEEQGRIAEAYRGLTGEELDKQVEEIRAALLLDLIDRKILLHRAEMLYDLERMTDVFYEGFRQNQGIESDEEFERELARQGMTVDGIRQKLLEIFAPDEVIRFEVGGRIAVGDREVDAYYEEHPAEFFVAGTVTFREIVLLADTKAKKKERRKEIDAIREEALSTEDFGELARRASEAGTKELGGLLGPAGRSDLTQEIADAAFSAPIGEISQVITMPYGFHLIRVEERVEDGALPLEDAREPLRQMLEDQKYFADLKEFMDSAREEAEWCVKINYRDRLSMPSPTCPSL